MTENQILLGFRGTIQIHLLHVKVSWLDMLRRWYVLNSTD
jgi:hypothetical protein